MSLLPNLSKELALKAIQDNIHSISVAAVIVKEHKLLLLKRNLTTQVAPGAWHIPGGKVEQDETMDQALVRELVEETGLELLNITYTGKYSDYLSSGEKFRTYYFYAEARGEVQLNYENLDYTFADKAEIAKLLQNSNSHLLEIYKELLYTYPGNDYASSLPL